MYNNQNLGLGLLIMSVWLQIQQFQTECNLAAYFMYFCNGFMISLFLQCSSCQVTPLTANR